MEETPKKVICGHRLKTCRKCKRRYAKEEYELWNCPDCGEDRHCQDAPMKNGSGKCRRAGGPSLSGIAHPNARTLEHSRYVPRRMRRAFKGASEDTNYLTLRFERDWIIARLDELARLIDDEAPGPMLWEEAEKAFSQFTQAQAQGSVPGMQKALGQLAEKLATGKKDASLHKEIRTLQEQLSRILMHELKLLKESGKSVPVVQVMNLMRRIQEIVFAHIKDREILRDIAAEFRVITGD